MRTAIPGLAVDEVIQGKLDEIINPKGKREYENCGDERALVVEWAGCGKKSAPDSSRREHQFQTRIFFLNVIR